MKKMFLLLSCVACSTQVVQSQNADNLYVNSVQSGFDYQAATFLIDSARPSYQFIRGLLMWASNTGTAPARQALSLDEVDSLGNPLTQRINLQPNLSFRSLQPKAIIKSQFGKFYYLLAHVVGSSKRINNQAVNSSAFVLKLDDNLNLVWSSKIHFSTVDANNAQSLIEYNDILETSDRNVVLVGRYGTSPTRQHALQITKLSQVNGANIFSFWYYLTNCNANGLSIEEASNTELVLTGYLENCTTPFFAGYRQLLFGRVSSTGTPIQFTRYFVNPGEDVSGDKINRFQTDLPPVTPTDPRGVDRFFITGFIQVTDATGTADRGNRQNLVLDIDQGGNVRSAAHWGDDGNEEANDHIFTRIEVPNTNLYEINVTGNTTSYGAPQAHISVLVYNANTFLFSLPRFDVINNVYPNGQSYSSRRGLEIKFAGQRRMAILLNSTRAINTPVYNQQVTNIFIRDYAVNPEDFTCYFPKFPPLKHVKLSPKDTVALVYNPNYRNYTETWQASTPLSKKLDCGPFWQIFPRLAARRTIRPGGQYRGPGDVVPQLRITNPVSVQQWQQPGSDRLYPNPANDEVNLLIDQSMLKQGAPITIGLYTPEGRLIRSQNAAGKPIQRIALAGLLPGMYLVQVQQQGQQRTYRFVKK
jgi:hypothetical protein